MKRYIVTEQQLKEYVEKKKAEKVFNAILEDMHTNSKKLKEDISIVSANQTVIENYKRKKLLTPKVLKMLEEHNLFKEKGEVL